MTTVLGNRYRILTPLREGGMASVYRALDSQTGQVVALKRLRKRANAERQRYSMELFEREFLTLSQLAHPSVVAVYDYGIDNDEPFYSMELLDGGDLSDRAPVEWKLACRWAHDVCSVLSLLHSRRMVYRDLSPRNVRFTSDDAPKLIDFGAMTPMGPTKLAFGTPAFSAPEIVLLQPVDARTDLYALGATLYFALVRHRPYRVRDFVQLREAWRRTPPRPSELVAGIPRALDALVMELIDLDPAARPASAGEVMERLSAIADLEPGSLPDVTQAYLTTPVLVGADSLVSQIRSYVHDTLERQAGASVLIHGSAGMGKTRMLDASVLEAKLAGLSVARVDSMDGTERPLRMVRALVTQLLSLEQDHRPTGLAEHVVLALQQAAASDRRTDHAAAQGPLRDWLVQLTERVPLMIAVDDLDRVDSASAAFLALLSTEAAEHALLIVATAQNEALTLSDGVKLFCDSAVLAELSELDVQQIETLLGSMFGHGQQVPLIAQKLHALSGGNPRDVMRLAQHLVDSRVASYRAGAWSLPATMDAIDLPNSMASALEARVAALSIEARELAQALALSPEHSVSFGDCLLLAGHDRPADLMKSLVELVSMDVVQVAGEDYALGRQGWTTPLLSYLDEATKRRLHGRLAMLFERRDGEGFRVAEHVLLSGEVDRGLDLLVLHAQRSHQEAATNPAAFVRLVQSLPAEWLDICELAIELCRERRRPIRDADALRTRILSAAPFFGQSITKHYSAVLQQWIKDSGLDIYASLADDLPAPARLQRALRLASERYEASGGDEHLAAPPEAIRHLVRMVLLGTTSVGAYFDRDLLGMIPSLEPIQCLSPAIAVTQMLVDAIRARITGRLGEARKAYHELLSRLDDPEGAGLDETFVLFIRLGATHSLGCVEASMGLESSLRCARAIESDPTYGTHGMRVRMLYHLWQGELERSDELKHEITRLELARVRRHVLEGTQVMRELPAHAAADDLTRFRKGLDVVERFAQRFEGWVPVLHWARGEYERMRGDWLEALSHLNQALAVTKAGEHAIWCDAAAARLRTLFELGHYEEAREIGRRDLRAAEQSGLGYECSYLKMPLALSLARLGEGEAALDLADAVLTCFRDMGTTGTNLRLAEQTRERVLRIVGSPMSLAVGPSVSNTRVREQAFHSPVKPLPRSFQKLSEAALQEIDGARRHAAGSKLSVLFRSCRTPAQRVDRMIQILAEKTGGYGGYYFSVTDGGPQHISGTEGRVPSPAIDQRAREFLLCETSEEEATRSVMETQESSSSTADWVEGEESYRPILLCHPSPDGLVVTGLVVLAIDPEKPFVYPEGLAQTLSEHVEIGVAGQAAFVATG